VNRSQGLQAHSPEADLNRVVARRAAEPVRLMRFAGQTFFQTLRRKLKWGDLAEREGLRRQS
jgi:hypothetical protein